MFKRQKRGRGKGRVGRASLSIGGDVPRGRGNEGTPYRETTKGGHTAGGGSLEGVVRKGRRDFRAWKTPLLWVMNSVRPRKEDRGIL